MIGGVDIEVPATERTVALDLCAKVMSRYWPSAVFDDAESGRRYVRFEEVPFAGMRELLVYRDEQTAEKWDEWGAVPELEDSMVHFLAEDGRVTVVMDHPDSDVMRPVLSALQELLRQDSFRIPAQVQVAA